MQIWFSSFNDMAPCRKILKGSVRQWTIVEAKFSVLLYPSMTISTSSFNWLVTSSADVQAGNPDLLALVPINGYSPNSIKRCTTVELENLTANVPELFLRCFGKSGLLFKISVNGPGQKASIKSSIRESSQRQSLLSHFSEISNGKGLFLGLCLIRYIWSATSFENAFPPRP